MFSTNSISPDFNSLIAFSNLVPLVSLINTTFLFIDSSNLLETGNKVLVNLMEFIKKQKNCDFRLNIVILGFYLIGKTNLIHRINIINKNLSL